MEVCWTWHKWFCHWMFKYSMTLILHLPNPWISEHYAIEKLDSQTTNIFQKPSNTVYVLIFEWLFMNTSKIVRYFWTWNFLEIKKCSALKNWTKEGWEGLSMHFTKDEWFPSECDAKFHYIGSIHATLMESPCVTEMTISIPGLITDNYSI